MLALLCVSYGHVSDALKARPKDALECGREAAALNKSNNEGGSFAAALQGLRHPRSIQSCVHVNRGVKFERLG